MPTAVVTLEDIRSQWPAAEDDPAKIKWTIWRYATAKPTPARYVMLVGDMSVLPCRRRTIENLPDNPDALIWRWGYEPTELYYSNLFSNHTVNPDGNVVATSSEFSTWDKNGNRLYGEQHWAPDPVKFNPDEVDGCPDVAIGRVPAHTPDQVSCFVGKDIAYERRTATPGRITLCFGRTYDDSYDMTKQIRDESQVADTFGAPNVKMLGLGYDKPRDLPNGGKDCEAADLATFRDAVRHSLWLGYLGHGSALGWDAALRNSADTTHINSGYVTSDDLPQGNLPIVFACGCDTGRHAPGLPRDEYLDVGGKKHWFWWGDKHKNALHRVVDADTGDSFDSQVVIPEPSSYDLADYQPRNFAVSWLLGSPTQGAIAYFGEELVCQNDMGRDLEVRVLRNLNPQRGNCILGDAWLAGQRQYWKEFHDYEGDNCVFRNARIYLGVMNFYGDPSLRVR